MKIISVMPAAAASSTAYWINGLSTIGSISFGLALVAGRKRVPSPATGNTAFVILRIHRLLLLCVSLGRLPRQQTPKPRLVQDRNGELLRFRELAAGILAGDDVIGLLRHAAGGLAARFFDQRLRVVARQRRQRAGQDD